MRKAEMTLIKFTAEDVIATSYVSISGLNSVGLLNNGISWYNNNKVSIYSAKGNATNSFSSWYSTNGYGTVTKDTTFYLYNSSTGKYATSGQTLGNLMGSTTTEYKEYQTTYEYKAAGAVGEGSAAGFYQKQ